MPGLEIRDLYQRAVYWPVVGYDSFGEATVGAPQEIPVRWNDVFQQVQDAKGQLITINAKVVCMFPDIKPGARMWLGTLDAWNAGSNAQPSDLTVGIMFNSTPDLKNRNRRREVGLMRHKDANRP